MYAIVDIETTGGNTASDRITEIAILLHDGEKVTETFSSLINPGKRIPYRISNITGITNDMVASAPAFYEVARKVVEMTEGRTFVAHNAKFDYNFIKNEFKSLGFEFKRKLLCTIELSRHLAPGLRSYSLRSICKTFKIEAKILHRAEADALSTAKLLDHLIAIRQGQSDAQEEFAEIPLGKLGPEANLHKELIDQLPREAGVYYFFNEDHQLIYIGKSVNIRSRVMSHFSNHTTSRALDMKRSIAHIRYSVTGSELIALLKESEEIKQNKPRFNRAQRRSRFSVGLHAKYDPQGYLIFYLERTRRGGPEPITAFPSAKNAKGFLEYIQREYELCQKLCQTQRIPGPCFQHMLHKCKGACMGEEMPLEYNLRAEQVLDKLRYDHANLLIVDKGRHEGEKSITLIEGGKYMGYGFIEKEYLDNDIELLRPSIKKYMDNKDVRQIIKLYLRQGKAEKVVRF